MYLGLLFQYLELIARLLVILHLKFETSDKVCIKAQVFDFYFRRIGNKMCKFKKNFKLIIFKFLGSSIASDLKKKSHFYSKIVLDIAAEDPVNFRTSVILLKGWYKMIGVQTAIFWVKTR